MSNVLEVAQGELARIAGATPVAASNYPTSLDIMRSVNNEVEQRMERIRSVVADIAHLHYVHNSVAPINCLPLELLGMIWTYTVDAPGQSAQLIRITHVCKHWRAIALEMPSLWTNITLDHPVGIATFLERSQSLPVHISLTASHSPVIGTLKRIISDIKRVRRLDLRIPAGIALEVITNRLRIAAPALEELAIEKLSSERRIHRNTLPLTPLADFSGVPSLRSLKLSCVPLLYVPKGPNVLTSIDLCRSLPSISHLLDLLGNSPRLQYLTLHGTLKPHAIQITTRIVELPHLIAAHLHTSPPQSIASLLSVLQPPPQAYIVIVASLDIVDDFEDIFPLPPSPPPLALAELATLPFRRLELVWDECELKLRAYRGVDDFRNPSLTVTATHYGPHPGRGFLGEWPFEVAHVETLVLCGSFSRRLGFDISVARDRWLAALRGLPELRTLRVMSLGDKTFRQFLHEFLRESPQRLCPRLAALELYDLYPSEEAWVWLVNLVELRVFGGSFKRLELFNVDRSTCRGDVMSRLQGMGVEIIVNEEVQQAPEVA